MVLCVCSLRVGFCLLGLQLASAVEAGNADFFNNTRGQIDVEIRTIFRLDQKPPYLIALATGILKPAVLFYVMGGPTVVDDTFANDEERTAHIRKVTWSSMNLASATFFILLAIVGFCQDVRHVVAVVGANMPTFEAAGSLLFAFSISSNLSTLMVLGGLLKIYFGALRLRYSWGDNQSMAKNFCSNLFFNVNYPGVVNEMRLSKGLLWTSYTQGMIFVYGPIRILVTVFVVIGGAIPYFYLFPIFYLPLHGAEKCVYATIIKKTVDMALASTRKTCAQNNSDSLLGQRRLLDEVDEVDEVDWFARHEEELTCHEIQMGASQNLYSAYVIVLFGIFGPVAARLICFGDGYFGSLHATWADRSFSTYWTSLMITAEHAASSAASTAHAAGMQRSASFFDSILRWLESMNYIG